MLSQSTWTVEDNELISAVGASTFDLSLTPQAQQAADVVPKDAVKTDLPSSLWTGAEGWAFLHGL